jgi:hypothetical protein
MSATGATGGRKDRGAGAAAAVADGPVRRLSPEAKAALIPLS